jgi:Ca2+/Na+ antiporter
MDRIRSQAIFCVGRAVLFAILAITMVMLSFAFDPPTAFKAGAVLGLVLAAVLLWFAQTAHRRNPSDTETWLLLETEFRPHGDSARKIFTAVMEEVYLFFAVRAFAGAIALFVVGIVLSLLGLRPTAI